MPGFETELRPFFEQHCIRCHGPKRPRGGMRLDRLAPRIENDRQAEVWHEVLDVLNGSLMPPEEEEQPTAEQLVLVIASLTDGLHEAQERLQNTGGVVFRRLNKRELQNSLHDLLGLWVSTDELLEDGSYDGFDTVGEAHTISSLHFERYLKLGHQALELAIKERPRTKSKKHRIQMEVSRNTKAKELGAAAQARLANPDERLAGNEPLQKRLGSVVAGSASYQQLPGVESGAVLGAHPTPFIKASTNYTLEMPFPNSAIGDYVVRLRAGLNQAGSEESGATRFLEVNHLDSRGLNQAIFEPLGTLTLRKVQPRGEVFELPVRRRTDGKEFLELRLAGRPEDLVSDSLHRPSNAEDPLVWIDWVEVEGPLAGSGNRPLWKRIFFEGKSVPAEREDAYARKIIRRFAYKAFRRREPAPAYVNGLLGLFRAQRDSGRGFPESIQEVLAIVLASPGFLYLVEDGGEELTQRELACRLSYYLWSAPPDAELYGLAKRGELLGEEVLHAQVERMLSDARAQIFIESFTSQWLELDRLDMIVVHDRFEAFDETLRHSFKRETIEFMGELIAKNLPAQQWIDSDFVMLDGPLAAHYGIPLDQTLGFHKTKLPKDSPRGGMLGQAGILTFNAKGDRTSPVERGVFVKRKLLGSSPPPPPPNVPQLSFEPTASLREQLALHISKPQCASCHRGFDPMGFGLEEFDAIGAWREEALGLPIDAMGTMPDGRRAFDGVRELKAYLLEDQDLMAEGLMKAMMTYAVGRRIGFADAPTIAMMHEAWKQEDYGMRALVHAVVQSEAFRAK